MIEIEIDSREVEAYLGDIPRRAQWAVDRALAQLAQQAKTAMQLEAPVYTGALRQSIVIEQRGEIDYHVYPTAPYAEEVITGKHQLPADQRQGFVEILDWARQKKGLRKLTGDRERARAWSIAKKLRLGPDRAGH